MVASYRPSLEFLATSYQHWICSVPISPLPLLHDLWEMILYSAQKTGFGILRHIFPIDKKRFLFTTGPFPLWTTWGILTYHIHTYKVIYTTVTSKYILQPFFKLNFFSAEEAMTQLSVISDFTEAYSPQNVSLILEDLFQSGQSLFFPLGLSTSWLFFTF